MKIVSSKNSKAIPADDFAPARLAEIQEQMRDMCDADYDEFYKVTSEYGFTKITIPKKRG